MNRSSLAIVTLCLALLGGCAQTYIVDVRNDTGRPVVARLQPDRISGAYDALVAKRVAPGRTATLGPVEVSWSRPVALVVELSGEVGSVPPRHQIRGGEWMAVVTTAAIDSWNTIHVELTRKPPPEEPITTPPETP